MVLPNAEPKRRITVRLLIAAGSLQEQDDELGLAHFVEHMIFRGTRSHPGDSLVAELQRMGVGFGPESAAFTNYDNTIYHLELPDTTAATLQHGLSLLREYAEEANFDPKLIDSERGVVLSEMATRDVPEFRSSVANFNFLWPDSRVARRPVIGTEATIHSFTREQIKAFYDAWYRPERIALIIVGDADADMMVKKVSEVFGSMQARAPARPEPSDLIPATVTQPDVRIFRDRGFVGVGLTFEHAVRFAPHVRTRDERIADLYQSLAFGMFQNRLLRVARETGDTLVSPTVGMSSPVRGWRLAGFSATSSVESWRKLAAGAELEHRRALQYGFNQSELEQMKETYRESLDVSVRMKSSRNSPWLAAELVGSLLYGEPLCTPETIRADMIEPLEHATLQQCLKAFRAAWESTALHVYIATNSTFLNNENDVAAVLNESRKTPVKALAEIKRVNLAYQDFGPVGKLAKREHVEDLDVTMAAFENGVRLNFKPTSFEADLVHFQVRVAGGRMDQPKNRPAQALVAQLAMLDGGLGRHTPDDLRDLLAAHTLRFSFRVEDTAYVFAGYASRRDFPMAMKLIAAYLTDAAFRPEALRNAIATFNSNYMSLENSPGGPIQMSAERVMFGDSRFGVPWRSEFFRQNFKEVKTWMQDELRSNTLEMSVVGDTTWSEVEQAVGATLGALPPRKPMEKITAGRTPRFVGNAGKVWVYRSLPKLKQSTIAWYWPVETGDDVHRDRRLHLLAAVVTERLRLRLREELGSAYSPISAYIEHEGLPKLNYLMLYAEVDAAKVTQAAAVVAEEIERLRDKGVSEEEFERVKLPFVRNREDDIRTNEYWCYTVLREPQRDSRTLIAARDRATDTASITRAEVQQLIKRFLNRRKGYFFVAEPESAGPAKKWRK